MLSLPPFKLLLWECSSSQHHTPHGLTLPVASAGSLAGGDTLGTGS